MIQAILVKGDICSKCQQLYPYIVKKCDILNISLSEVPVESAEVEVTSLPTLYFKEDGVIGDVLDFDGIVERYQK